MRASAMDFWGFKQGDGGLVRLSIECLQARR